MRVVDNVKVSTKLWVGFGVVLGLLGSVGGLALVQASNARDVADDLAGIAEQLHKGGQMATSVNRLRANALAFLLDSSEARAKAYQEREAEALTAVKEAGDVMEREEFKSGVAAIGTDLKTYTDKFGEIIKTRTEVESLYTGTMDPVGLKAADAFYQTAKSSAAAGDTATASACFEGVLEMNRTRVRVQRYLISKKPEDFTNAMKAADKCKELLTATAAGAKDDQKTKLEDGTKLFGDYVAAAKKVYELSDWIEVTRRETLDPLASRMSESCAKMSGQFRDEAESVEKSAAASINSSRVQTTTLGAAAVFFGLASAWVIARSIGRPVRSITDRLKDIAQGEGDLTRRLDVDRQDEFGELSTWFNKFVSRVHEVVKDVAKATTVVNRASTEIAAASEEMAQSLSQQSTQTHQVSAAVEELSSTVAEVARKSEEASSAATSAKAEAETGGKVVTGTIGEMKLISQEVSTSASAVNELGKKSEQIGQIIEVINDIADQTNLLALNAAIEAARAGEHGRGFAVVADEVRKLAERTQKATEEVAKSIRDIQNETGSAVKLIESGAGRVTHGVELANSAGDALGKILVGSEKVGSMVMSIASAATEQAAAAEQIARSVENINASSTQTAEGAQQSARSAADLRQQAEVLQKLVGTFRT